MLNEIIEGIWDDHVNRTDLRGHRVRITVCNETHFIDDSRDRIYCDTSDDAR